MDNAQDRINAAFLLGAIGDTLGAPVEGIFSLEKIIATYGPQGLRDIIGYINPFENAEYFPPGRVTDDTTMMMTVAASLLLAQREASPQDPAFTNVMRRYLWQGFLNWGQHQDDAAEIAAKIDPSIRWPDAVQPFWFHCGAGSGTIAALKQDECSRVNHIIDYTCTVRGKTVTSPNQGCGGMMRVAPVALLPQLTPAALFELAAESAAPTNAHPDAYVAAGITALYIHFAAQGHDCRDAIEKSLAVVDGYRMKDGYKDGIDRCLLAIDAARDAAASGTFDFTTIDALPDRTGDKNPFLAVPVLAQVTYAWLSVQDDPARVTEALVLSANHRGDSDSVAAITGHILGARYGMAGVPQAYLAQLLQKDDITAMAAQYHAAFFTPPAPSGKAGIKKPGF